MDLKVGDKVRVNCDGCAFRRSNISCFEYMDGETASVTRIHDGQYLPTAYVTCAKEGGICQCPTAQLDSVDIASVTWL